MKTRQSNLKSTSKRKGREIFLFFVLFQKFSGANKQNKRAHRLIQLPAGCTRKAAYTQHHHHHHVCKGQSKKSFIIDI